MIQSHHECLLCGSERLKPMPVFAKAHLVKCQACGFVLAGKIPTEQELIEHYKGYGRNDYLSPVTIKRYHELLDEMEPYRKHNRIMDVGCGIGYFLEVAKERGWEVFGTEFTDEAVEICRGKGISMQQGVLDVGNYDAGSFDVVASFEVLEHINNPQEEIEKFFQLLRPGGLVYLTTPNFNAFNRYYLKEKYNVITYPEHLSYYTPKTLKAVFRHAGFKTWRFKSTGLSITRIKTSQNKSNQQYISATSDDEKIRQKIEEKRVLQLAKKLVNWILTISGKGDTLKGYFVKPKV
jgi:2-polyprenyl-3-methyl-5-hydroxy-6-metoxy-1,4-benzoquinol methylase